MLELGFLPHLEIASHSTCAETAACRTDGPQAGGDKGKRREEGISLLLFFFFFEGRFFHFSFPLEFPFLYSCFSTGFDADLIAFQQGLAYFIRIVSLVSGAGSRTQCEAVTAVCTSGCLSSSANGHFASFPFTLIT